jgi:hypothetical protein
MMTNQFGRLLARIRFTFDKVPHQIVHYTLTNEVARQTLLKLLQPFPGLKSFLKGNVLRIQQSFFKKRILYQRSMHPSMVLKKKERQITVDPKKLTQTESAYLSPQEVLRRIEQELK